MRMLPAFVGLLGSLPTAPNVLAADFFYLQTSYADKCAHVFGGTDADGAYITLWDCVDQANLKFEFVPSGDADWFYIRNQSSGKCLHVSGASLVDNAAVLQWTCMSLDHFKWRRSDAGNGLAYYQVKSSGKCLHAPNLSTANGIVLTQWTCLDQPHFKWRQVATP